LWTDCFACKARYLKSGIGTRDLLDRHRKFEHAHARAAIAFGDLNAEHYKAREGRDDLVRKLAFLVPARGFRVPAFMPTSKPSGLGLAASIL